MNEDLGDVSRLLGNIKNQAIDTNSELNRQNQQLDVIQDKVGDAGSKLKDTNKRTEKLNK